MHINRTFKKINFLPVIKELIYKNFIECSHRSTEKNISLSNETKNEPNSIKNLLSVNEIPRVLLFFVRIINIDSKYSKAYPGAR